MRIGPAVRAGQELHVHFDPVVQVRIYDPEALRLERQVRSMATVAPRVAQPVQTESHSETALGCYKNTLHTISMICGVSVLPSFACVAFGTLGLIAPAVLASIALTCALLGGKPTEQMARARAQRAVEMSQYDPR
jgi:hypothetical protein